MSRVRVAIWRNERGDSMKLLTPRQLAALPLGTHLVNALSGVIAIKGEHFL